MGYTLTRLHWWIPRVRANKVLLYVHKYRQAQLEVRGYKVLGIQMKYSNVYLKNIDLITHKFDITYSKMFFFLIL